MQDEKPLSEQESLDLITKMINKAKCDYRDTGVGALLWGSVITFCSLVAFLDSFLDIPYAGYVWYLTFAAIVPQVIISVRHSRQKKFTSYSDDAMGSIWLSFGIGVALFFLYANVFGADIPAPTTIFLIAYGFPTFATGYARRFKPMIIGGIACWVFAVANMFTPIQYSMLYSAVAAQLAWFIPGLILRKRYLKAKRGNV